MRCRIIRGFRRKVDVEDRGDQSLAVELQENFAAVAVLREQLGLANVGKVDFVLMGVILEDGFGLRDGRAAQKRDPEPVVDEAAGDGKLVVVVERVELLEVKLSVAELHVDGIATLLGVTIEVEEVAGKKLGAHAGFGVVAIVVEGGEGFGFRFVGAGDRRQKAVRGHEEHREYEARDRRQHERSILETFPSQGL